MDILIFWIGLSIFVGYFASKHRGRSGFGWFVLSLIVSPLIGVLILLLLGENREKLEAIKLQSGDVRKCPFCAELIKFEAVVCKHCGRELE